MEWYRDYSHIGYDIRGMKIAKPAQGDEVSMLHRVVFLFITCNLTYHNQMFFYLRLCMQLLYLTSC